MTMTREGNIELEAIDTNCNACKHFTRDVEWAKDYREKYKVNKLPKSKGYCNKKGKDVYPNNGLCTPENNQCWESRR